MGRHPQPLYTGPLNFPALALEGWGAALADWRLKVGCTRACLADRLGVSTRIIEEWENNRSYPSRPMRAKLDKARCK